ncbi:MAG: DnaD domain protein [Bacilli bacterium]
MEIEFVAQTIKQGGVVVPNLLLKHYKQLELNGYELAFLLQIMSFHLEGETFPTPSSIAERMTLADAQVALLYQRLVGHNFITISNDETGKETVSLDPLYEKLAFLLLGKAHQTVKEVKQEAQSLYSRFEAEFGRPLSPLECETLKVWTSDEKYNEDLIIHALKEAVLLNKLNLRYIDRILYAWRRRGITTVAQVEREDRTVVPKKTQEETNAQEAPRPAPVYNWLEQ